MTVQEYIKSLVITATLYVVREITERSFKDHNKSIPNNNKTRDACSITKKTIISFQIKVIIFQPERQTNAILRNI